MKNKEKIELLTGHTGSRVTIVFWGKKNDVFVRETRN